MIYADLTFLANLVIDGALLVATGKTRRLRIRWWRIFLSAALGSLYVLLMLVPDTAMFFGIGVKLAVSILMVLISFGYKGWQVLLRNLAAFYLIAFAAAGGIYGLYYFFLPSQEVIESTLSGVFSWPVSTWSIVLCFAAAVGLYLKVFRGAKQKEALAAHTAPLDVQVGDFHFSCTGLVDTGNQLYDPLTRTPVMIVEAVLWKDVLPEAWLKRIQSSDTDQIIAAIGSEEFIWQDRLRMVPYRGINRSTQFMLAIKPDKVKIDYQGKQWEATRVLIGFDGGTLSSDGAYQAIIHPMLLQE